MKVTQGTASVKFKLMMSKKTFGIALSTNKKSRFTSTFEFLHTTKSRYVYQADAVA